MKSSEKEVILTKCNALSGNTLMGTLDIEFTDVGADYLIASMPVTSKVHQPDGVLHGGAMVALAESVGSAAAYVFLDIENSFIRGIEIAANHVKSVKDGYVHAKATLQHKGSTIQLWNIHITNDENQLISVCKLTTIKLQRKK